MMEDDEKQSRGVPMTARISEIIHGWPGWCPEPEYVTRSYLHGMAGNQKDDNSHTGVN